MKLIWHITKKDLVRLAAPLAGFVLAMLAKITLGLILRAGNGSDGEWFHRIALYLDLSRGLEALVVFVLVAMLVHEDAVVGTQVFWRTRPIPGGMLLRSKVFTCALIFGVLPLIITLPWWLVCGYGLAEMGRAALEVLAWQVEVALPAFALAVLADNLGRYISLIVVAVALGGVAQLMGMAYLPGLETVAWGVLQSRSVFALTVALVGLTVVIARQFRRRTLALSYATWAVMVIVIPLVMWGWSVDIFAPWRAKTADSSGQTSAITVTPNHARIEYFEGTDPEGPARSFQVNFTATGIPLELIVAPRLSELSWRARDGVFRSTEASSGYYGYLWQNRLAAVRQLLELPKPVIDEETDRWEEAWWLEQMEKHPTIRHFPHAPSPEELRKEMYLAFGLRGTAKFEPPTLKTAPEITTDFVLGRPRKLMELPLQPCERMTRQAYSVRITQVRPFTRTQTFSGKQVGYAGRHVDFVETQPDGSWPAPHWQLFPLGPGEALSPDCWLLTRDLGTAVWGGPIAASGLSTRIDGVQVSWRTATIEEPRVIRHGIWTGYRPDWDQKVTLAFFTYHVEEKFRRTLKLEQIQDAHQSPKKVVEVGSGS